MGFEQLAALRQQLTEQAEQERRARQKSSPASDKQAAPDARPGKAGAPQGRTGKPGKPSPHAGKPGTSGHPDKSGAPARAGKSGSSARSSKPGTPQASGHRPSTPAQDVDPVVVTISRLQRKFPKAFPKKPAAKVPLKLGVHEELLGQAEALGLPAEDITLAIKTWCQGARYWACLVENAARVSLDGEAVGVVTAVEAKRARQLAHRQRTGGAAKRKKPGAKPEQGDATAATAESGDATADQNATPVAAAVGTATAAATTAVDQVAPASAGQDDTNAASKHNEAGTSVTAEGTAGESSAEPDALAVMTANAPTDIEPADVAPVDTASADAAPAQGEPSGANTENDQKRT